MIIANKLTNVNLKTVCAHNITLYTSLTDFCIASMELCYDVIKEGITRKVLQGKYQKEGTTRNGLKGRDYGFAITEYKKRSTPKD